jgi:hypothetical protein
MGCGTVHYNSNKLLENRPIFKPYPDEINGINDKVSNAFNNFLKNHGASTKPGNRDRPKLNFDIKDTKNFRKMSVAAASNRASLFSLKKHDDDFPDNDMIGLFSENKSDNESSGKVEEKSFFMSVPRDYRNSGPDALPVQYKVHISVNLDSDVKEINELEEEAEVITAKYF